MATLTLRLVKGSPLTNAELDANFSSLDQAKVEIGGDLGGTTSAPLVARLQGYTVSSSAPVTGQVLTWTGVQWESDYGAANISVVDDISNFFDGITQVFSLRYNGVSLVQGTSYGDSCDLSVQVDGRPLSPYIAERKTALWISEFTAGRTYSFKMLNNKITFFRAPRRRTTGFIQINTVSTQAQLKPRYPISPNTIVFGD